MNEHELQQLTQEISRTSFHREFTHKITYNKRLRSSGGRYLLKTGNIEINPLVEQELGLEALIGVIKHELCHYHLHQTGGGYRHRDADFKTSTSSSRRKSLCRTHEGTEFHLRMYSVPSSLP